MITIEQLKEKFIIFLAENSKKDSYFEAYYKDIRELAEDLQFFDMYIKRNKKSKFQFKIIFTDGITRNFLIDLYKNYSYNFDQEYIEKIYILYNSAKMIMDQLYNIDDPNTKQYFSDEEIKEFSKMLKEYYNMNLSDYTGDFIGCSMGCSVVAEKLEKICK